MKRRYIPTRTRALRSMPRIMSDRSAIGRLVPILDEGPYTENSEIGDWLDEQAEADPLLLPHADTNRRWH